MPQVTITSNRQVEIFRRLDADFHVAIAPVRVRARALAGSMSADHARSLLRAFRTEDLGPAASLTAGTGRSRKRACEESIQRYPYLSLALAEREAAGAVARVRDQVRADLAYLDVLARVLTSDDLPAADRITD